MRYQQFIRISSAVAAMIALLAYPSCRTARLKEFPLLFSDSLFDVRRWDQPENCCIAKGKRLAIASGGELSSKAGIEILNRGGNIVDVAVAVAFALSVELPQGLGLGGGGFMNLHLVDTPEKDFYVDFRESAPRLATANMFLDEAGNVRDGASLNGVLSVATPGFVAGLYDIHKKLGKIKWTQVLEPAIQIAENGFPASENLVKDIRDRAEVLKSDSYLARLFLIDGENPIPQGTTVVQKELAKTLYLLAKYGKDIFYKGALGRKIVQFIKSQNGILDLQDLRDYKVQFKQPLSGSFRQFSFTSAPPPSGGGLVLNQVLNVLSSYDLLTLAKEDPTTYLHLLAEAMSRSYADRSQFVGDPDDPSFNAQTFSRILSKDYFEEIGKQLNVKTHTASTHIVPGNMKGPELPHTSHLAILDSQGSAISCTLSINYLFGSGRAVPGTGIILNDTMDDFSVKVGEKNVYGLVAGENNAIRPNRRPVSSMSPTIVFEQKKPILVLGAAGGSRIISSVLQVILNDLLLYNRADLRRAVSAPRIHHQWIPDRLVMESGFPQSVMDEMRQRGHEIRPEPLSGVLQAVHFNPHSMELVAVHDPREGGGAQAQ